jgi:hypothetical protein
VSPNAHYRFLPSYLRAVDRVISVSSSTSIFPLPQAILPSNSSLVNGTFSSTNARDSLGSDESLGGALLTPIPWLRGDRSRDEGSQNSNELVSESTEMVEGPNGTGRIETVTVSNGMLSSVTRSTSNGSNLPAQQTTNVEALRDSGAVTQGELLRQEQEAGVVPINQAHGHTTRNLRSTSSNANTSISPSPSSLSLLSTNQQHAETSVSTQPNETTGSETIVPTTEEEAERPHARGPAEIGAEDMGPQSTRTLGAKLDIEAAVGRPAATSPGPKSPQNDEAGTESASVINPLAGQHEHTDTTLDNGDTIVVSKPSDEKTMLESGVRGFKEKDPKAEGKDDDGDYVLVDADAEGGSNGSNVPPNES